MGRFTAMSKGKPMAQSQEGATKEQFGGKKDGKSDSPMKKIVKKGLC